MNQTSTIVTFLATDFIVSGVLSELKLRLEEGYGQWRITYLRADGGFFGNLMFGSKEECQAALRLIFEFIAHCGQIETPAIMIDMKAVAQKVEKVIDN